MPSRRCNTCSRDWPSISKYMRCPVCDTSTWWCSSADPMTQSEADHEYFENRYWPDWERARLAGERGTIETVQIPEFMD